MISGAVLDLNGVWQTVANLAGAVALWAQQRSAPARDVDLLLDLMERLRHPYRYALRHPVATVRRAVRRRV